MQNNINIGAAIIVKNEADNIKRCLDSIRYICNQIVIVDTGSDDLTPIIAASYGADVLFYKWQNDFSKARNFAIKHLYTDWILYIDADEELDVISFNNYINDTYLKCSVTNRNIGGFNVIINNFLDDKLATSKKHRFTRIFKNDCKIEFTGKIHEQIADSIVDSGYEIAETDIIINHYGYIGKNIDKETRNKDLLEKELSQNTNDDFIKYHLANTEFAIGNNFKALELFEELLYSNQLSILQIEEVKIKISQIYLANNQFENVSNILNFTSNDIDNEGLRLSIIGVTYLYQKEFDKAKQIFSQNEVLNSKLVDKNIINKANQVFELTIN